jgi:hypothetical protein
MLSLVYFMLLLQDLTSLKAGSLKMDTALEFRSGIFSHSV